MAGKSLLKPDGDHIYMVGCLAAMMFPRGIVKPFSLRRAIESTAPTVQPSSQPWLSMKGTSSPIMWPRTSDSRIWATSMVCRGLCQEAMILTRLYRTQAGIWVLRHAGLLLLHCHMVTSPLQTALAGSRFICMFDHVICITQTFLCKLLTGNCSWSALGGVLVTGVNAGGPPVMIWGKTPRISFDFLVR